MTKLPLAVALAALLAGGCTEHLPPPAADLDTIVAMRSGAELPPLAVGAFTPATDLRASDRGFSVRLGTFKPPAGQGWSAYLGETLAAQLRASGKLDPASRSVVTGELVRNRSGENMADGKAVLAARFQVRRDGRLVYDKEQQVEASWGSSYWGFVAYEAALRNYTALYPKLVGRLLADPAFQAAVRG